LRNARILYKTQPADICEVLGEGEPPEQFARRLAQEKAQCVFDALRPEPGTFVLGADTIVVVDDEVLGKPAGEEDAARMLRLLSGRHHEVTTGVCLIGVEREAQDGTREIFADVSSETTQVSFGALTEEEIQDYIATGEPMDKAGAYAIQGVASRWISRIEGDYFNVVGLPVARVCGMLRGHGAL